MSAPPRCRDCFFERCGPGCACRCHRATRCTYCRTGYHALHDQSVALGHNMADVVACECDDPTFHHRPKEPVG